MRRFRGYRRKGENVMAKEIGGINLTGIAQPLLTKNEAEIEFYKEIGGNIYKLIDENLTSFKNSIFGK